MQRTWSIRLAIALLIGAILVSAGGASAEDANGKTLVANGKTLIADGKWTALAANQQDWYAFEYVGDSSQIVVEMDVAAPGAAGFFVWTPKIMQSWQFHEPVVPIGRGTLNRYSGDTLVWSGAFNEAGTYYVAVSSHGTATDYALTIKGQGVYFALPAPAETKAAAEKTASGASPDDPIYTATGEWAPIGAGQQVWYAFPCGGSAPGVTVRMAVDVKYPASFSLWTADRLAANGEPAGRGSANPALGGDLIWVGGFDRMTTCYVEVRGGSSPTGYALTIK